MILVFQLLTHPLSMVATLPKAYLGTWGNVLIYLNKIRRTISAIISGLYSCLYPCHVVTKYE